MTKYLQILFMAILIAGCKSPEARRPVTVKSGSFIKKSAERNIKLNQKEKAQIEAVMERWPEHDYIASESGFWYYYNTKIEGDSLTPQFGNLVNFDYNVKNLNGGIIYTKEELGNQDYAMDQEELFTGLREGLKLMKAGETVTFLFPSQKAYGYYGDTNRIGTSVPLICQVTVNSITQTQND